MRSLFAILIAALFSATGHAQQRPEIQKTDYRLVKSVYQGGCKLKFWEGIAAGTKDDIVLERVYKKKSTFFNMPAGANKEYSLTDKNNDGNIDFVKNYHGYDIIYLFNERKRTFEDEPVYIAEETGILDGAKKIYWSYRAAQYGDHQDFSVLYQFRGNKLVEHYKIVYITEEDYSEKIVRVNLYKMPEKTGEEARFIRTVITKNPAGLNYKTYWKKNYKRLTGLR